MIFLKISTSKLDKMFIFKWETPATRVCPGIERSGTYCFTVFRLYALVSKDRGMGGWDGWVRNIVLQLYVQKLYIKT